MTTIRTMSDQPLSRAERRKQQIRSALVGAARRIYAERGGSTDVSIQLITDEADVGFGSFYNHFSSKAELFETAIAETLEEHAAWLERLLADETDPAAVFATSMRLTGRLVRSRPQVAQVMMGSPFSLLQADLGHAPHALRDITAAAEAGRFRVDDPAVALACTAGALLASMRLCILVPDASEETIGTIVDGAAANVLRMFRVDEAEVKRLVGLPLPSEQAQSGR